MKEKNRDTPFRILMVMICTRCTIGGAEKRYARVFKMLIKHLGISPLMLISRSMFDLLKAADILTEDEEPYLIVLDYPFSRLISSIKPPRFQKLFVAIIRIHELLWYIWQYLRSVQHYNPDVIHPLLTALYLSLPLMILRPQQRYVTSDYSTLFRPREYFHASWSVDIATQLKRWVLKHSDVVDALKDSIRINLITQGVNEAKIRVAPCSFTDVSLCDPAQNREKWVVFLARLIEHKNPILLIEAIPQIIDVHPDTHFYILGEGPLEHHLKSLLQTLHLTNHTTLMFEAYPTQILNHSSIFVSLQTHDNYPSQSLLEAMACGNAIVATDVGETQRLVDEHNGIRIPPTKEALANAIIRLLNDPELGQKQQMSQQRVLTEHTPERFFQYITQVYQQAVAESSK